MSNEKVIIGILKIGCIASSPFIDLTLDERADRDNITIRSWSTGAKMDKESSGEIGKMLVEYNPDLAIVVSPNASLPGPSLVRALLADADIPFISVSDSPSRKAFFKKGKDGNKEAQAGEKEGFLIVPSDPMIGARREFLDSVEMVLFNADILKVLSTCGVIRGIQSIIDKVIDQLAARNSLNMPKLVLDAVTAVEYAKFSNPYAKAKALAALHIAENVAKVTSQACFKETDPERYIILASSGHEMVRAAAMLADEAREIEKSKDSLARMPHAKDGKILKKSKLSQKPK